MKLIRISIGLFLLAVVFLGAITWGEAALISMSPSMERGLTFMLLVLPAGCGAVLGAISLRRGEGRAWLAITLVVFNTLFALFHLMVVLFAG